jgi:predicted ribosomally synthesized peptide with SipW-like signal peptide
MGSLECPKGVATTVAKNRFKSKTYLKFLVAAGVLAVVGGGAGTFATFNAETKNAGNTFATGTLLLSDSVHNGTACYSDSGSANAGSCSAIINTSNLYTNHTSSEFLTISNTGSLDSSDLKLFGSTCVNSTVGTFSAGSTLPHTGDVCAQLKLSLEQNATAGGTATACLVGSEVGSGDHSCDPTQGDSLGAFLTSHGTATNGYDFAGDSIAAGASRYYTVHLYLPDENNTFQGRAATFDLTWHIDQ